jgi:hypothetical protein
VFGTRDPIVTPLWVLGTLPFEPLAVFDAGPVTGNGPRGMIGDALPPTVDVSRTVGAAGAWTAGATGAIGETGDAAVAGGTSIGWTGIVVVGATDARGVTGTGFGLGLSTGGGGGVNRTTTGGAGGSLVEPCQRPTVCMARKAETNRAAVIPMDTTMLCQLFSGFRRSNHCGPLVASTDTHPHPPRLPSFT